MPNATINGLNSTGNLSFGLATRQMLNLWGTKYGIGVQSQDTCFRTDTGASFAWFAGGSHSNAHYDPGFLGSTLMTLDTSGLTVKGKVSASVNSASLDAAVTATNQGSSYGVYGRGDTGAGVIGESTSGDDVIGVSDSLESGGVFGANRSSGPGAWGETDDESCTISPAGALPPPEQADPWSVCAGVYGKGNGLDAVGVVGTGLAGGEVGMSDHGVPLAGYAGAELRFYVTNVGDAYADGTYNSPTADLAEMLPAEESRMRENLTNRSRWQGMETRAWHGQLRHSQRKRGANGPPSLHPRRHPLTLRADRWAALGGVYRAS